MLPYPWEAFVDNTGRTFYVNHETKSSQWTRPDMPQSPQQLNRSSGPKPLPQHPQAHSNQAMPYLPPQEFYPPPMTPPNNQPEHTSPVQYSPPNQQQYPPPNQPMHQYPPPQQQLATPQPQTPVPNAGQTGPPQLAYPWEAFVDAQGRTYYVNHETKSSQWTIPDTAPMPQPVPQRM